MRHEGVGEQAIRNRHMVLRASLVQAMRWGWITSNPAALAKLTQPKTAPRGAMTPDEVRRVLAAAHDIDPAAELALRLAAMTGARRAELAALRWTDLDGDRLTIERGDRHRPERGAPWRSGPAGRADEDREPPGRDARSLDHRALAHARGGAVGRRRGALALRARRRSAEPGPDRVLVARGAPALRYRHEVASARPAALVGDLRHRWRPRRPHGRRPPRSCERGHHAEDLRAMRSPRPTWRWRRRSPPSSTRETVSQPTVAGSTLFSMSSVELDENLLAAAQREADRRGVDVSVVVNEAVQRFVVGADLRQLLDEFRRRRCRVLRSSRRGNRTRARERRAGRRPRGSSLTEDVGQAGVWRVVVDPNVLVSAAIAAGNPQLVVELAAVGAIRVLACPLLLDELERVLSRDRFLRWRTREQLDRFLHGRSRARRDRRRSDRHPISDEGSRRRLLGCIGTRDRRERYLLGRRRSFRRRGRARPAPGGARSPRDPQRLTRRAPFPRPSHCLPIRGLLSRSAFPVARVGDWSARLSTSGDSG